MDTDYQLVTDGNKRIAKTDFYENSNPKEIHSVTSKPWLIGITVRRCMEIYSRRIFVKKPKEPRFKSSLPYPYGY